MSLQAISSALKARGITPLERLVLVVYADHCDPDGKCWPSQARVAEKIEVGRQSVNRATKALEQKGLIQIKHRQGTRGGQTSNEVHLSKSLLNQGVANNDTPLSQNETPPEPTCDTPLSHEGSPPEPTCDTNLPIESTSTESSTPKAPKGDLALESEKSKKPESLPHGARFAEAWRDWEHHRKEIRKKLTPTSRRRQLAKLAAMTEKEAVAIINYTIEKGWQGLREPEPARNGHDQQKVARGNPAPEKRHDWDGEYGGRKQHG